MRMAELKQQQEPFLCLFSACIHIAVCLIVVECSSTSLPMCWWMRNYLIHFGMGYTVYTVVFRSREEEEMDLKQSRYWCCFIIHAVINTGHVMSPFKGAHGHRHELKLIITHFGNFITTIWVGKGTILWIYFAVRCLKLNVLNLNAKVLMNTTAFKWNHVELWVPFSVYVFCDSCERQLSPDFILGSAGTYCTYICLLTVWHRYALRHFLRATYSNISLNSWLFPRHK